LFCVVVGVPGVALGMLLARVWGLFHPQGFFCLKINYKLLYCKC
jgi:hypothetical protein